MSDIDRLVEAAKAYYYGNEQIMSDREYDTLLDNIKASNPDFNVFSFLEFNRYEIPHSIQFIEGPKEKLGPEDFYNRCSEFLSDRYEIEPKYDGVGIAIYYNTDESLNCVLTKSNDESGLLKTQALENIVPKKSSYKVIQCEAVIDLRCASENGIDRPREKAIGLINSKYMGDEVSNLITLVVTRVYNWNNNIVPMNSVIVDELVDNNIPRFVKTPMITSSESIPKSSNYSYFDKIHSKIDGVVILDTESGDPFIFKFYYNEQVRTKITEIEWNFKESNFSWAPRAILDPIIVDNCNIGKCSVNGLKNMMYYHYGVGAIVEIAKSGSTIPQIVNLIEGSDDYQFPVCECGAQLTPENNTYGSVLKCNNPRCSMKRTLYEDELLYWNNGYIDREVLLREIKKHPSYYFIELLKIDRFNKSIEFTDDVINEFIDCIGRNNSEEYMNLIYYRIGMSDLQWNIGISNANVLINLYNDILNNTMVLRSSE